MGLLNHSVDGCGVTSHGDTNWRLHVPQNELAPTLREELIGLARTAIAGRMGAPHHRSRYADTWAATVGGTAGFGIFIKLMEAPRGIAWLKRIAKGSRGAHIERITQALNDSGFSAPSVLLRATNHAGAELVITEQAEGDGPLRALARLAGPLARKRALLRGFGRELARFHRCGFVHGDLTPFNIFFIRGEPIRFALIDNERTRRISILMGQRPRLRNLVQLGRFALPHLSRTDRLRVLNGYAELKSPSARRVLTRRLAAMLDRRLKRDGGLAPVPAMRADPSESRRRERP
ncbi:MAG TPA: lipopolysaccharide kinase InaA family protein [Candidatus Binataceae bacterium]|nr:lipopolysaccharide kinase InaA family protein [Candidatus Binataceae bacterium]